MLGHLNGINGMNNLGEGILDKILGTVTGVASTAGKAFTDYSKTQQSQAEAAAAIARGQQPVVQSGTNWSKVLLYGGLAVGGVALVMYVIKKRRGRR